MHSVPLGGLDEVNAELAEPHLEPGEADPGVLPNFVRRHPFASRVRRGYIPRVPLIAHVKIMFAGGAVVNVPIGVVETEEQARELLRGRLDKIDALSRISGSMFSAERRGGGVLEAMGITSVGMGALELGEGSSGGE